MLKLVDTTSWVTLSRHETIDAAYAALWENREREFTHGHAIVSEPSHAVLVGIACDAAELTENKAKTFTILYCLYGETGNPKIGYAIADSADAAETEVIAKAAANGNNDPADYDTLAVFSGNLRDARY